MAERERDRPADYDFIRAPAEVAAPIRRRPPATAGIVAVVLVIVAAVAAYIVVRGPGSGPTPAPEGHDRALPAEPAASLGSGPLPVVVPPLDQSDPVVRELVRQLTSNPRVAAWLATDGLIRNFTVVMANTADGATPARHLRVLRPSAPFSVVTSGKGLVLDPRSYRRYDELASAVASIQPEGASRIYATLKPRIGDAYKDLGHPDTPVDQTLERALIVLLDTPIVQGPIRVHPVKGTGYGFDDPRLESLKDAQKQLVRTGPENQKAIQDSLRSLAVALGVPASRLPAARTIVTTE